MPCWMDALHVPHDESGTLPMLSTVQLACMYGSTASISVLQIFPSSLALHRLIGFAWLMPAGLLHSRTLLDLGPLASLLTPPIYSRMEIGLALTPTTTDAGADACIVYPFDQTLLQQKQAAGVALSAADLPSKLWPAPSLAPGWSPLSFTERDYVRVAGPGFYVGCAYRRGEKGELLDDEHVYFALVKTGA